MSLNSQVSYVSALMYMRVVQGLGTSFLKVYGNVVFDLPFNETRYTFICRNASPGLHSSEQSSLMFQEALTNFNVRFMVAILYFELLPPLNIMRERFQNHFNTSRSKADANMQVHQIDVLEEMPREGVIREVYRGTHDGNVTTEHMVCPMEEDRTSLPPTYRRSKPIRLVFVQSEPVVQITVGRDQTAQKMVSFK